MERRGEEAEMVISGLLIVRGKQAASDLKAYMAWWQYNTSGEQTHPAVTVTCERCDL